MSNTDIVHFNRQLEAFIAKHQLEKETEVYRRNGPTVIKSADELEAEFLDLEKERVLRIGIVGRVKAGKSSLLNMLLFNGEDVLPKAATPMTAALTKIQYAPEYKASIEFFTKEDWEKITKEHAEYEKDFEKTYQEKLKSSPSGKTPDGIKREVKGEMKNSPYYASYDQYERSRAKNIDTSKLVSKVSLVQNESANQEVFKANSLAELAAGLSRYVGADGELMPITKSVTLYFPEESIKGVEVIDTPGLNDPIASREQRTKEMLSSCDVVFIVSPSGHFLSQDDMELLYQLVRNEGLGEIYIIASQIDMSLIDMSQNKQLSDKLNEVRAELTTHRNRILDQEFGEKSKNNRLMHDLLERLTKHNLVLSSGLAFSMLQKLRQERTFGEGEQTVWGNLRYSYPQETDKQPEKVLEELSARPEIETVLTQVSQRKEGIIEEKLHNKQQAKTMSLNEYRDKIYSGLQESKRQIEEGDIDSLQQQRQEVQAKSKQLRQELNHTYQEVVNLFFGQFTKSLKRAGEDAFSSYDSALSCGQRTVSESYTVTRKKDGWWNSFIHWLNDDWGVEEVTKYSDTFEIRTTTIVESIVGLHEQVDRQLHEESDRLQKDLRSKLHSQLKRVVASLLNKKLFNNSMIENSVNQVLSQIPNLQFALDAVPSSIRHVSSYLYESEARSFKSDVQSYMSNLKDDFDRQIRHFDQQLSNSIQGLDVSAQFIDILNHKLETLESQIKDREANIRKYANMLSELDAITL